MCPEVRPLCTGVPLIQGHMVALGRGGGSYERGTPVRPAQTQPPYHARILEEAANSQFSVRGSCFNINTTATGGLTTTHHFLFPGVAEVHP